MSDWEKLVRGLLVDIWFHLADTDDKTLRGIADRARELIPDVVSAAPERGEPDTDDRRHWIDFVITRWNEMDLPVERRLEEALHSLALARFPDTSPVPSTD